SLVTITRSPAPAPRASTTSCGSPSGCPWPLSICTTSKRQPTMLGCLVVATALPRTRASCMAPPPLAAKRLVVAVASPQAEKSKNSHRPHRRRPPLPGEGQRGRHAFAGRRRDAETQVPFAANAQGGHARAVLDEQAH